MRVIEKVKPEFWEDIAGNCVYATFFHTPYWSQLMERTFSYRDITKGFIFDDGTRVVFPFMLRKKKCLKGTLSSVDYISGALFVYGGPIADGAMTRQKFAEIIAYLTATFRNYDQILIRGNPYADTVKPDNFMEVKDFSQVVELFKYRHERDLIENYPRISRKHIRKAKKSNILTIKESTVNSDVCEKLYKIYMKSFKSWGREALTSYPLALFQNFNSLNSKYIKFWAAYYKKTMIGGEITMLWNNYCLSFFPFYDREYSELETRRYVEHHIFLDCLDKKVKFYDYLQSGGIKGVEFFKRSMGARVYPHSAWLKRNKFLAKIRKLTGREKFNIWRGERI